MDHIEDVNDLSKFELLTQDEQLFKLNINGRTPRNYECLNLLLLNVSTPSIFAVKGMYNMIHPPPSPQKYAETAECGIFNIDNKLWTSIKPYKYWSQEGSVKPSFQCDLCSNQNNDKVYLLYNRSLAICTSKYDVHKNEWRTISIGDSPIYMHPFWYSEGMLYGLSKSRSQNYLNSLDLRDSKRKWIKTKINFDGLNSDDSIVYFQ